MPWHVRMMPTNACVWLGVGTYYTGNIRINACHAPSFADAQLDQWSTAWRAFDWLVP